MITLLCVTSAYVWLLLWLHRESKSLSSGLSELKNLQQMILEMRRCFVMGDGRQLLRLSGGHDPLQTKPNQSREAVLNLAKSAFFQGYPWGDSLVIVSTELLKSYEVLMEEDRLKALIIQRIYFIIGLGVLGRWLLWLNQDLPNPNWINSGLDTFGPILAIVLVSGGWQWGSIFLFRGSWIWQKGVLSSEGYDWLRCSAGLPISSLGYKSEYTNQFQNLLVQEKLTGVGESFSQRCVLEEWAFLRNQDDKERLNKIMELLPVGELLGLGIPLSLFFSGYLYKVVTQSDFYI